MTKDGQDKRELGPGGSVRVVPESCARINRPGSVLAAVAAAMAGYRHD